MIAYLTNMEQSNRTVRFMTPKNLKEKAVRKGSCGSRQGWRKPKGAPKQPLSAYNLFYQYERQKILSGASSSSTSASAPTPVGFAPLTRCIADKWKQIDPETRQHFERMAAIDKTRYAQEKKAWSSKVQNSLTSMLVLPSSQSAFTDVSMTPSNATIERFPEVTKSAYEVGFVNHKVEALTYQFSDDDESSRSYHSDDSKSLESFKLQQLHRVTLQNMASSCTLAALGEGASISSELVWDDNIFDDESKCNSSGAAVATSPACCCPVPLTELRYHTSISKLASTLDDESIDMLMGLFD